MKRRNFLTSVAAGAVASLTGGVAKATETPPGKLVATWQQPKLIDFSGTSDMLATDEWEHVCLVSKDSEMTTVDVYVNGKYTGTRPWGSLITTEPGKLKEVT